MSQTLTEHRTTAAASPFVRSLRWGIGALAVAIGSAIYGAYGDPHPKAGQQHAVPFICAVLTVLAIGLFAGLLPIGLRGVAAGTNRWSGWALVIAAVGLVSVPVSFWSGLPVLLGTTAAVLGSAGRKAATSGRALPTAAFVVGALAAVGGLVMLIVGNTVGA